MLKKHLLAFLVSFVLCSVNAQRIKGFDCILLRKSIESEVFQKQFYICNTPKDSVIIKDTSVYFNNCELSDLCSKKIYLSNSADNLSKGNVIIVYRVSKANLIYNLYFFRPATGASLSIKFKYKKDKVKLLSYKVGAF